MTSYLPQHPWLKLSRTILLIALGLALAMTILGRSEGTSVAAKPLIVAQGTFVIALAIQGQTVPAVLERFVLAQFPNGQFELLDHGSSSDSRSDQHYASTLLLDDRLQPLTYIADAKIDIPQIGQRTALLEFSGSQITELLRRSPDSSAQVLSFPQEGFTVLSDVNAIAQDWLWVRVANQQFADEQRFAVNLLVPLTGQRFTVEVTRGKATITDQGESVSVQALRASANGGATLLLVRQDELIGEAVSAPDGWQVVTYRVDLYPQGFTVQGTSF